jgi:hypothetical protein
MRPGPLPPRGSTNAFRSRHGARKEKERRTALAADIAATTERRGATVWPSRRGPKVEEGSEKPSPEGSTWREQGWNPPPSQQRPSCPHRSLGPN